MKNRRVNTFSFEVYFLIRKTKSGNPRKGRILKKVSKKSKTYIDPSKKSSFQRIDPQKSRDSFSSFSKNKRKGTRKTKEKA